MSVELTLARANDALDELLALDPDDLTDGELDALLAAAIRLGHRTDALARRLAPSWERRALWAVGRVRNAVGRLAARVNVPRREAARVLTQGRQLLAMPEAAAALAAGEISIDHVDRLAACTARRRLECYQRDEVDLVERARTMRFTPFAKHAAYWRNRTDAEVGDDGDAPNADRHFGSRPGVFGERRFFGDLDPLGGAEVAAAIDRIAVELAAVDRAHPGRVTRSQKMLRADALVEMARRAFAVPPGGRKPRPLVTVVIGQAEFERLCELSDGAVIGPGELVPHLDAVDIETMLFDGAMRAIGKSDARSFTGALRRAIEVRDRHCQHPDGCDAPIDQCDVDHVLPVHLGGETCQDNGRLLCRFHNRVEPAFCTPPPPAEPLIDLRIAVPDLLAMPPPFRPRDPGRPWPWSPRSGTPTDQATDPRIPGCRPRRRRAHLAT